MKKKLLTLGLASAVVLGAGALAVGQASAHYGDGQGRNFDADRHAQMQEIIANQDYAGWLEIVGDKPVTQYVNEGNFDRFVEMVKLRQAGDLEGADAIRAELGMPERGTHRGEGYGNGNGMGKGQGQMNGRGMGLHRGY